jgi:putative FmdB family regulatory protein
MPIYAYQCESCGHAKDVLQKMSDAPLTDCPVCGAASFRKQLTAAGFQLKGSGWYATDFKVAAPPHRLQPAPRQQKLRRPRPKPRRRLWAVAAAPVPATESRSVNGARATS